MRKFFYNILLIAAALFMASGLAYAQPSAFDAGVLSGAQGRPHISAQLQAENPRPAPGEAIMLAIVMTPEPGWHGYWENPGDAGKALELDWTLPQGAMVGALRYPVPETLVFGGLMNHIYEARYAVLTELQVPRDAAPGSRFPLRAKAHWLACTDSICVPEQTELSLDLIIGPQAETPPANRTQFDEYRRALPRPLGGRAVFNTREDGTIQLSIPFPASAAIEEPHFFALNEGATSYAASQSYVREGDTLFIALREFPKLEAPLRGILRIGPNQGVMIEAQAGVVDMPPVKPDRSLDAETGKFSGRILLLSLVGAIVGGLILNIMPCVFPILSVKAMSLMRESASPAHARAEAWAYTAGVMFTCMLLGGAVLALRAAGTSVGWAFQLQSPLVILVLLALCLAIALNLAGLFRLSPVSLDGALTTSPGLKGDFWSGILVAFVATPCTGPFMATALGTALVLPPLAAMAIFAGLGLGIALPFLLLAYAPALRNRLPRPGVWMEHVQRWLSVPMFLTAAALLWLLWRQVGMQGLVVGAIAALLVGVALWWLGNRQDASEHSKAGWVASLACIVVLMGGMALLHMCRAPVASSQQAGDNAFSEAALAQARASGKPVFLYFTADWCLSCKVNEAGAIARDEVQTAFKAAGVQTLVGDWTNGDPDITRFLEAHGRSGVPLYLWYPASGGAPKELPQILTVSSLTGLVGETQ